MIQEHLEGVLRHHEQLACPDCKGLLLVKPEELRCDRCGHDFPVKDGVADFARGQYYDSFEDPATLSPDQLEGLRNEVAGTVSRIEDFYLPLIRATQASRDGKRPVRVLDSGCGNGMSVDLLSEAGIETWGNDISALRRWQWKERTSRDRLVVADSRRLPFSDGFFDFVLSSGVLEHIGVREEGGDHYLVEPLPDRDTARVGFLRELLRVTSPDGNLLLDFPNGSFPIDFWHGVKPGGARFHSLSEGFLPKVAEVRRYAREIGSYTIRAISPNRRLRMRQVGQHWYGRLLRFPMATFLQLMDLPVLRLLAGSPLNPYLVLKVQGDPTHEQTGE